MTQSEYLRWIEFYRLYPFDDFHRLYRPAALVASAFGGELQPRLDWLQPDPRSRDMSDADMSTLRAFGFTGKGR